ncbi:MAG: FAD-binding oxidoreductase [Candidatus Lernaella stagnicola]|nr:FAD-binding oxidoreductase [Candidatus Lernaella stagnicola]
MSLAPSHMNHALLDQLRAIVGKGSVSLSDTDRLSYCHDNNPVSNMSINEGRAGPLPDVIVWPSTTQHVQQIVRLAAETKTPLIPYGAGSGVCGGTVPLHGGIILDLKRMKRILELDEESLTVTAEAGILGQLLEMELNRRGYTLGHFPSSIYSSTLGGYLAARSAGQCSSKYGKMEDMVQGLEAVLGTGDVIRTPVTPRASLGPDWNQILIGSEGTLGVITEATCRIRPAPAVRRFVSFEFPDIEAGTDAMRQLMSHELEPAAMRLYDELDTAIIANSSREGESDESFLNLIPLSQFGKLVQSALPGPLKMAKRFLGQRADLINALERFANGCLMVATFEGDEELSREEKNLATLICEKLGGVNRGPQPAMRWHKNRYHVSYFQSKVFYHGALVDTIEMAASWRRVPALYHEVRNAVRSLAFIMAHFSHVYLDGCSVYFTFVTAAPTVEKAAAQHRAVWDAAVGACHKVGGTISHHHGVGYTKAPYMVEEHGAMMRVYDALKKEMDPHGILNPGKMGLA